MRTFRRSRWLFYVMSLCVLGSAAWFPVTIMAQVLPGSPFEGGGGGGGATYPVSDEVFKVADNGDPTKIAEFEASGISTGTTRTFIFPNFAGAQTLLVTGASAGSQPFNGVLVSTAVDATNGSGYWLGAYNNANGGFQWGDTQTPDTAQMLTGSTGNSFIVVEAADRAFDFAHAQQTNPTLFIHSANQSTTQWWSATHNQTNAEYTAGTGGHFFRSVGNLDSGFITYAAGIAHWVLPSTGGLEWSSTAASTGTADTGLTRNAAGVIRATAGGAEIRGLIGGGTAVASAAALPLPTGRVFHVTGTTNVTSITSTNFASGAVITLIFDGILTFTDGNNIQIAGNFVTTASDTITLVYDGTNWYEIARAVN